MTPVLAKLLSLLEEAATIAESLGIREAVIARALIASIAKIEARADVLTMRDNREGNDHG